MQNFCLSLQNVLTNKSETTQAKLGARGDSINVQNGVQQ